MNLKIYSIDLLDNASSLVLLGIGFGCYAQGV